MPDADGFDVFASALVDSLKTSFDSAVAKGGPLLIHDNHKVDYRFLEARFISPDSRRILRDAFADRRILDRVLAAKTEEDIDALGFDGTMRQAVSAVMAALPNTMLGDGTVVLNAKLYSADEVRDGSTALPSHSRESDSGYVTRESLGKLVRAPAERGMDVFDLRMRDDTAALCDAIGKHNEKESHRAVSAFLAKRATRIMAAQPYRFAKRMEQVFVEKHRNSAGEREMPFPNMWLECALEVDGYHVHGLSLVRCHSDRRGRQEYYDAGSRSKGFDWDDISVFFVGFAPNGEYFHRIMTLGTEASAFEPDESINCPFCDSSLHRVDGRFAACVSDYCCSRLVGVPVYDLKDKSVLVRIRRYASLAEVSVHVRSFVANVLDFIMYPDVVVRSALSEERYEKRDTERKAKGKPPLPRVKLIEFDGVIARYIGGITSRFSSHHEARAAHWVQGHFFRFWSHTRWRSLYENLEGCASDEDKQARLSKLVRKDVDGLPKKERYRWNAKYEVIEVLKMAHIRNAKAGEPQSSVRMLKVRV